VPSVQSSKQPLQFATKIKFVHKTNYHSSLKQASIHKTLPLLVPSFMDSEMASLV
jgi:hypothetical protein